MVWNLGGFLGWFCFAGLGLGFVGLMGWYAIGMLGLGLWCGWDCHFVVLFIFGLGGCLWAGDFVVVLLYLGGLWFVD